MLQIGKAFINMFVSKQHSGVSRQTGIIHGRIIAWQKVSAELVVEKKVVK